MSVFKAQDFLAAAPRDFLLAIVSGEETWFRDQAVSHLLAALPQGVEVERFDAEGETPIDPAQFFDELRMASLFGTERVIVLARADKFLGKDEHGDAVARFLKSGEQRQRLVLAGESLLPKGGKGAPARGPLKDLPAETVMVSCDPLFDAPFAGKGPAWQSPLSRWVVARAAQRKRRLSMEDAWLLHRLVGNNLAELDAALEKLSLALGKRAEIRAEDIESACGGGRLVALYDIADSVVSRQSKAALESSRILFERGLAEFSGRVTRDPMAISMALLAVIAGRLRTLGRMAELVAGGQSAEQAAATVEKNNFAREKLCMQFATAGGQEGSLRLHTALVQLDADLKSGGGDPRVLFERLVVQNARQRES